MNIRPDQTTGPVDLSTRLLYGFGGVAAGATGNGFNYLLLFFYSQVVGLPAEWVSFGIFIALIFDAVSDPLVGHFSDNLQTRWGRRHPLMYAAGLPVAVAYYFLWAPPDLTDEQMFFYFVILAVFIRTLLTFYEIPSSALLAELTVDYDQRSRLTTYRLAFAWWAGLTMALLVYLVFLPEAQGGMAYRPGWKQYGLTASILILLSIYISAFGTHRHIPSLVRPQQQSRMSPLASLRSLPETLSNRSFLVLFVSALFTAVASGVSATLAIYFYRHFWELTTLQIGYMQVPYLFATLLALLLAPRLADRLGKKQAAMLVAAAAAMTSPAPLILRMLGLFPDNGSDALYYSLVVIYSIEVMLVIASGSLVAAMIADVVEDSELRTRRRSEGTFFAANSLAQKAVTGLGILVAGQLLAWVEFPAQAALGEVAETTLHALARAYIPALWGFTLVAVGILALYPINRHTHADNVARLHKLRDTGADSRQ